MYEGLGFTKEQREELASLGSPTVVRATLRTVVAEFKDDGRPLETEMIMDSIRLKLSRIRVGHQIDEDDRRDSTMREYQQMAEQAGEADSRDGMQTVREVTVIKTDSQGEPYEAKMDIVWTDLAVESEVKYDSDKIVDGENLQCPKCHSDDVLTISASEFYCNACDHNFHGSSDVAMEDMLAETLNRDMDLAERLKKIREERGWNWPNPTPTVKRIIIDD